MSRLYLYSLKLTLVGWLCAIATWSLIQWTHPNTLKIVSLFAMGTLLPILLASLIVSRFFILPMAKTSWMQDQANAFRYKCNLVGVCSTFLIVCLGTIFTFVCGIAFYNLYRESARYTGYEVRDLLVLMMLSVAWGFGAILLLGIFQGSFLFRSLVKK